VNEAFGQRSTVATIGGAKETLTFGVRYSVRHGEDDVLRDALLGERAPNGDLIFYRTDLASSARADARYRVRPSTIDSIVETRDYPPVPAGAEPRAYLAHVELILGGAYSRWIGTDEGQAVLAAAAKAGKAKLEKAGAEPVDELPAGPTAEVRSWRDRNQVWRCPICKRRTRAASCSNGHPEELAPAGKRRESRS
jgi:hypothetical protein